MGSTVREDTDAGKAQTRNGANVKGKSMEVSSRDKTSSRGGGIATAPSSDSNSKSVGRSRSLSGSDERTGSSNIRTGSNMKGSAGAGSSAAGAKMAIPSASLALGLADVSSQTHEASACEAKQRLEDMTTSATARRMGEIQYLIASQPSAAEAIKLQYLLDPDSVVNRPHKKKRLDDEMSSKDNLRVKSLM